MSTLVLSNFAETTKPWGENSTAQASCESHLNNCGWEPEHLQSCSHILEDLASVRVNNYKAHLGRYLMLFHTERGGCFAKIWRGISKTVPTSCQPPEARFLFHISVKPTEPYVLWDQHAHGIAYMNFQNVCKSLLGQCLSFITSFKMDYRILYLCCASKHIMQESTCLLFQCPVPNTLIG